MYRQLKYINSGSIFLAHQRKRILHITTHLGGGVGSTILGLLSENKSFQHEVVSFGYTFDYVLDEIKSLNIPYKDHVTHKEVLEKIPDFDIVLVHTWNHPLLYDFLVRNKLPPCRLVMWGHNSGFHPPNIFPKKILEYPDMFVFTTPLSYRIREVKELSPEKKKTLYDIWSTDGVDKYKNIEHKEHKGFIVGYIGTVDYAKLHPDFLKICQEIDIPDIKFIVIGGLKEKEIEAEAKKMGIADKFKFTGFIPKKELINYLKIFDVFGYPLAPYHYGTCDLALQIAMGCGVVPVVLDNPMEQYMVESWKTGIITKNKIEYINAIKTLYYNDITRRILSDNAKKEAFNKFSLKNLDTEWQKVFEGLLRFPKTIKEWNIDKKDITPKDVFLESLGHYGINFEEKMKKFADNPSWQTETKGSVHNYYSYFPNDPYLFKWSSLMKSSQTIVE